MLDSNLARCLAFPDVEQPREVRADRRRGRSDADRNEAHSLFQDYRDTTAREFGNRFAQHSLRCPIYWTLAIFSLIAQL